MPSRAGESDWPTVAPQGFRLSESDCLDELCVVLEPVYRSRLAAEWHRYSVVCKSHGTAAEHYMWEPMMRHNIY